MAPSRCTEGDTACRMDEMRAEHGMTRERVAGLENRLEAMQQLLEQILEHQRADEAEGSGSRRRSGR